MTKLNYKIYIGALIFILVSYLYISKSLVKKELTSLEHKYEIISKDLQRERQIRLNFSNLLDNSNKNIEILEGQINDCNKLYEDFRIKNNKIREQSQNEIQKLKDELEASYKLMYESSKLNEKKLMEYIKDENNTSELVDKLKAVDILFGGF